MRGVSGGAIAGVAVGVVALAGLSVLASPEVAPGEIGVVSEVAGAPAGETAEEALAIHAEMPGVESEADATDGTDLAAASDSPGAPPVAPAETPPAVSEPPVVGAPEVATAVPPVPEPGSEPVETQVAATAEPDAGEPIEPPPLASETDGGTAAPAGEALQANGMGGVPAPAEPAGPPLTEMVPLEPEVATSEPGAVVTPRSEQETAEAMEPPVMPSAPEVPARVGPVPEETVSGTPPVIEAGPPPEIAPPELSLAQAGKPVPVQEEGASTAGTPPGGPAIEGASGEEVASVATEEEPALPRRIAVGGLSLPGGGPVRVNRPGAEEQPGEEVAAEEPVQEAPEEVAPAVQRYAAAWEVPAEARPLMSLVLLDDGTTDPAAVAALPWPVSVALDPSGEGAAERLAAYRAQGIEALVLAELPKAAQPVDVEVFLGAALDKLPETVAVLDLGQGGLGGRDATAQMAMSRVARDGRGLLLGDQGFRSGLDLAGREGVPAAEVLRDLDGEGQDGAAIRRGLDDAVRRAGQEGQAVVVGRMRPETLAALGEWSLEGRVQEVTVAPVSAMLGAE